MPDVLPVEEDVRKRRRARISQLRSELTKTDDRIHLLSEVRNRLQDELEEAEREDAKVVDLPTPKNLPPARGPKLTEQALRDGITRLGTYTLPELKSVLGSEFSLNEVKRLHAGFVESKKVRATGQKFYGQAMYEYLAPAEPGNAFEAQQAALAAELVTGGIVGTGGGPIEQLHKVVQPAVRYATERGWSLVEKGDGHFRLEKPGYKSIGVSHTPRNAGAEADRIETCVRNRKPTRVTFNSRPGALAQ